MSAEQKAGSIIDNVTHTENEGSDVHWGSLQIIKKII